MKIDFSAPIKNLDGSNAEENGAPVTLGMISINALLATLPDPRGHPEQLPGTEKVKLGMLAQQIHTDGTIDLQSEDISLLKDRIGKSFGPLVVMQAWNLLDP